MTVFTKFSIFYSLEEGCIKDGENILNIENVMQRDAEI
jgi:hypothetical protein